MAVEFRFPNRDPARSPVRTDCYRGLNLLGHAQLEELEIGSRCGGHGVCGGDRVLVLAERRDVSPATAAEREHLAPEELAAGWRLACQCYPAADGLEIPVEVPPPPARER